MAASDHEGRAHRRDEAAAERALKAFKALRIALLRDPMRQTIKFLHKHELSYAAVVALMTLRDRGSQSISDLSTEIGLSLAATSQLVDKLVKDGLVRRTATEPDRRRKEVALAAKGQTFLDRVESAHSTAAVQVLLRLRPASLRKLTHTFEATLAELGDG
jgi:DNA-binding MarR family transcriptional regulator